MIALAAAAGAALALAVCLVRLFQGPTLYDRALAASGIAIKAVLIAAALAALAGETLWLDIAFALALAQFVVSATMLKFFRLRSLQAPLLRGEEAEAGL